MNIWQAVSIPIDSKMKRFRSQQILKYKLFQLILQQSCEEHKWSYFNVFEWRTVHDSFAVEQWFGGSVDVTFSFVSFALIVHFNHFRNSSELKKQNSTSISPGIGIASMLRFQLLPPFLSNSNKSLLTFEISKKS